MAVESATYPPQLVPTNPSGLDPQGEGDDHLRLLKVVLKTTFPNLTSPVDLTPAQLNAMTNTSRIFQPGIIVAWAGTLANLPTGWKLCNGVGTISTGASIPDLRDRFIVGAGGAYAVNARGGAISHTHAATLVVHPHAISEAQMPSHAHPAAMVWGPTASGQWFNSGRYTRYDHVGLGPDLSSAEGGGQAHPHGGSASVGETMNIPPFCALAFIIKN